MEVKSITDGYGKADGAFCPDKMAEAGVDVMSLSSALVHALEPFSALLKDGHGFGAYINGDDGSIIGFTAPTREP